MSMPIEKAVLNELQARKHYGDDGPEHPVDVPGLPVSEAERDWVKAADAKAHADVAREYAEKYGYLYGFVEGLQHKLMATEAMLHGCQSPECVNWAIADLQAMIGACIGRLEQ